MPMSEDDLDELRTFLKKAKKEDATEEDGGLAFGLCLGKQPQNNVLYLDRLKPPETVMRRAKADGDTSKLTCGRISVKGKVVTVNLTGKMLPNLAKNLKIFFTKNGFKLKVIVIDPDGGIDEAQEEDDLDLVIDDTADTGAEETAQGAPDADGDIPDAPPPPPPPPPPENAAAVQWGKVEQALTPLINRFTEGGDARAPAVRKAWDGATEAAGKGDYKSAIGVATKLRTVVADTSAPTAAPESETDPDKAKWDKLEGPLSALYFRVLKTEPANKATLEQIWKKLEDTVGAGQFAAAVTLGERLEKALEAVPAGETEIPKDVVPFQKSRVIWESTRKKMLSEMKKLEAAIVSACSDDPELSGVVSSVSKLTDRLSAFDEKLEDILIEITNTPEGADRTRLKQEARGAISVYRNALDDDFFKDVDSNNGFTTVSIAGAAQASLASIDKVLAA